MISMSNLKSVAGAASYYAEDNYYTQDESTARSAWQGEGAALLGLSGPVEPQQFVEILKGHVGEQELGRIVGRDAATGELVRDHRPGYDITLSAPKSVSILAEVDGRADVRAAHEAAVDAVIAYMEKHLAHARVTEAGETLSERTGNLLVARFHHTVSRMLDPQTHTHLVIANATKCQDGQWRSLDNSHLYRHQKLLGAIYGTELAANMRQLGYRIEPGPKGNWEVAGLTRAQVEHFSQRAQAIEERLQGFGLTRETATAAQREDAALRTRPSKPEFVHDELREQWRERAQAIGISFPQIERQRAVQERSPVDPDYSAKTAEGAVAFALAHISERECVMTDTMLIETALLHVHQTAPWSLVRLPSIEHAVDAALQAGTALRTPRHDITTAEAMQREAVMLDLLEKGRLAVRPVAAPGKIQDAITVFERARSQHLGQPFELTSGQEAAAMLALSSGDRFIGLQGYAGVGKTTMLELLHNVADANGYRVLGMAPSAEAARTLQQESGIESRTTAAFLTSLVQEQRDAAKKVTVHVTGAVDLAGTDIRTLAVRVPAGGAKPDHTRELWVLDEASLAGQREVTELMQAADRNGARLILVGDRLQLNAVESGKPFELLLRHNIAQAEMTQINRQQVQDLRDAVSSAVNRKNVEALAHLRERIVEIENRHELFNTVARDIVTMSPEQRARSLLIVPRNADRNAINNLVRDELQNQGLIAQGGTVARVFVRSDFTEPQRQTAGYFEVGMAVRFNKSYRDLGMERGDYAEVRSIHALSEKVSLKRVDGQVIEWNPARQTRVEPYLQEERAVSAGDLIRFTRNNNELDVRNGTPARVVGFDGDRMHVEAEGRTIQVDLKNPGHAHWDYAYAITVYAAQGRTADSTNFLITKISGRAMGERSFYVGITRPRTDLKIYTDSTGKTMQLIQQMQEKSSAIEGVATQGGKDIGPKANTGRTRGADLEM